MQPILWEFTWQGQCRAVRSYQALMLLAVLVTWILGGWLLRRANKPWGRALTAMTLSLAALYVGARISYWLLQRLPGNRTGMGGLWLPGGIVFAGVVLFGYCRVFVLDFAELCDRMMPALGVGGAILRVGCYLQGCCFGHPTSLPWGVVFPWGSPAHQAQAQRYVGVLFSGPLPVHPTQLYELLAFLVVAGIGARGLRSRWRSGTTTLFAVAWFSVFRMINALLRVPDPNVPSSQMATIVVSLGILAVCMETVRRRCQSAEPFRDPVA
jgi:phosphatidylglycerol:prolipoprotein diacylglycerol transferase